MRCGIKCGQGIFVLLTFNVGCTADTAKPQTEIEVSKGSEGTGVKPNTSDASSANVVSSQRPEANEPASNEKGSESEPDPEASERPDADGSELNPFEPVPNEAGTTEPERDQAASLTTSPSSSAPSELTPPELIDAGAATEPLVPCEDIECDLQVVRYILDLNDMQELDTQRVVWDIPKNSEQDVERIRSLALMSAEYFGVLPEGLHVLPPEVGRLTALEELLMSGGNLTELPAELGQLQSLTWLGLASNAFGAFPRSILALSKLLRLDLESNQIEELPDDIDRLVSLQSPYLSLYDNKLCQVPRPIFDWLETRARNWTRQWSDDARSVPCDVQVIDP